MAMDKVAEIRSLTAAAPINESQKREEFELDDVKVIETVGAFQKDSAFLRVKFL